MKRFFLLCAAIVAFGAGCVGSTKSNDDYPPPVAVGSVVNLSGRGLTSIPMDVFSDPDTERLDLSRNQLTGAPPSQIGQLTKLKYLDLSRNQLTGLPAELGRLKNLETLDVSNNQLTGLPLELGNLTQLRVLDVSGNDYSTRDLEDIAAKLTNTKIIR